MKTKSLPETNRTGFGAKRMKQLLGTPIALALVILATGCAGDGKDRTAGQSIDDAATSRRVLAALNEDTAYKYPDVKVATYRGKVQLSGFVDKDEQKDHANDVAKKTQGVKDVRNDIVVK